MNFAAPVTLLSTEYYFLSKLGSPVGLLGEETAAELFHTVDFST